MKRKTGYYWVRFNGEHRSDWEIGFWHSNAQRWILMHSATHYEDKYFLEINENKIER